MTTIPQCDPRAGYLAHKEAIDAAIAETLYAGHYILGSQTQAFEQEFAEFVGVQHGVGVASGTDAIELALRACGVVSGDLVVTVSHTAVATVAAIERAGATPVLVDIDPVSYTMDPRSLEAALGEYRGKVKAVIPVHLYGHPADMTTILRLTRSEGLRVIEDCAQAHGAMCKTTDHRPQTIDSGSLADEKGPRTGNRKMAAGAHVSESMVHDLWPKVGSMGDLGCFSFYPTKNLGALGDGGMVVTDNPDLAERVRQLRQYGWRERYISDTPGVNSRLDELQAAILRVKLRCLDADNRRRIEIAETYNTGMRGSDFVLPTTRSGSSHVYHQYVIRCRARDRLSAFLRERGIGTGVHYPLAVHQQPAYSGRLLRARSLETTETVAAEVLSLPMYPELDLKSVERVVSALKAWR